MFNGVAHSVGLTKEEIKWQKQEAWQILSNVIIVWALRFTLSFCINMCIFVLLKPEKKLLNMAEADQG